MENKNKEILDFLSELKKNNSKEWFDEHRKTYKKLRDYFVELTRQLIDRVSLFDDKIAYLEAGKCIFRINRDIRFSKDKSPYKTNFGTAIVPDGKKNGNPGYYLHLEPENSFIGGGVYCPRSSALKKIRRAIYQNPEKFIEIIENETFIETYGKVEGRKLVRIPREFDKNFKYADLLKFKDYVIGYKLTVRDLMRKDFVDFVAEKFYVQKDFNNFLYQAMNSIKQSNN